MGFNHLTNTLRDIVDVIDAGAGRLLPYELALLGMLILFDLVMTGSFAAVEGRGPELVKRTFYLAAWVWVVMNFKVLAVAFVDSCIKAGSIAGGKGTMNPDTLLNPSLIAGMGLDATEPVMAVFNNAAGLFLGAMLGGGSGNAIFMVLVFGLGWFFLLLAYFAMAILVFLAVLEFHLNIATDGFLLPFRAWKPTGWIADKAMGGVIASGVKLMSLSMLLAMIGPILAKGITRMAEEAKRAGGMISVNTLLGHLILTICLAYAAYALPKWAGHKAGGASLGGLDDILRAGGRAAGAAASVPAAAVGAGAAAVTATKAATSVVGAAAKGASFTAGAMTKGAQMGSALAGPGAMSRFVGGAGGALRGGANAVGGALKERIMPNASVSAPKPPSAFSKGAAAAAGKPAAAKAPTPIDPASVWSATAGDHVRQPAAKGAETPVAAPMQREQVHGAALDWGGPHVATPSPTASSGADEPEVAPAPRSKPGAPFEPAYGMLQSPNAKAAAANVFPPVPPPAPAPAPVAVAAKARPEPAAISPAPWAPVSASAGKKTTVA
jgi:type IV secretion system protein TrbL